MCAPRNRCHRAGDYCASSTMAGISYTQQPRTHSEALAAMAVASSPHSNDLFSTTARCGVFILRRTPDGTTRVNKLAAGKIVWRMCVTNSLLSRYFALFRVPSVHSHCMPIASGIAIRSYARACHGSDSADSTRARETLPTSVATARQKGQRFVICRHFIQTSGRAVLPLRTCSSTLSAGTASTKLTCLCNACPNFSGGSLGRAVKKCTHRITGPPNTRCRTEYRQACERKAARTSKDQPASELSLAPC